ncbi:bloodthirsty-related gene family, member 32 [Paramisgurnus dabryanus]|uniref:bloodthirsty-related gene family, member 32 n=1 Tax=Paramisgurnus dabryanus TaxID=90735 RepID=UPI0031F36A7A
MASSSGPLNEELQCLVCLDVFSDPVTTPCGHNFCLTCLEECWKDTCVCPVCKEIFMKRPDLKINTTLREVVQLFKEKFHLRKSEVSCDMCTKKAMKTCLICQSSYCETHLEPHLRVQRLKKHTLISPVENLDDYICQKHQRPLELFCKDDQVCVCLSCTEGDHMTHNTVPIEEESQERKTQVVKTQEDVQLMIQDRIKKIQDIRNSAEMIKKNIDKEKSDQVKIFTNIIRFAERSQSKLMKKMDKKQKTAEKQAEDLIKDLEKEICELKRGNIELKQISNTEDHLHLIQIYPSTYRPVNMKSCSEISLDSVLKKVKTQLMKTLENFFMYAFLTVMQHQNAVDVTLDPDTAHPYLILSDDEKQVRHGDIRHHLLDNPKRFDTSLCVLGKEGVSSGCFYFKVQVIGKTDWVLGVARESVNRKGEIELTPANGFWTLALRNENEYKALAGSDVSLSLKVKPKKIGVFVDYEGGLVIFYNVNSRSCIYSYNNQSFNETLYPFFSPCNNDNGKNINPLIILPVRG